MPIDKQNPTQQQQQPLSLSDTLSSLSAENLRFRVRSMPNSRLDLKEQQAFLQSILEQALEIAADVDHFFSEDSLSATTDNEEEENSRSPNQSQ
jgi:hypothetical protein